MNKIDKLKYTAVIAGVGLAVVVFSNGVHANTDLKETEEGTEAEIEVIAFDLSEDNNEYYSKEIQFSEQDSEEQTSSENDLVQSAGVGNVLENIEDENIKEEDSEIVRDSTELSTTEQLPETTEPDNTETTDHTEPESAEMQDETSLSAGAGTVFEITDDIVPVSEPETQQEEVQQEEPTTPETYWGYTNLGIAHVDNHLNIRQEPNENGKLIGKLSKDAACEVLEIDENGWAHIKSGKVEGYCSTEFLYLGDAAIARGCEVASMIAVVNTQTLKVRGEPNTDSIVITLIPQEEELEVVEIMENGWIKFLLDDEEAYVSGDYVDVEERLEKAVTLTELKYGQGVSNVRVDMVQYAKQFVGNPYVWGGISLTNGTDCSGFTMSIYKKYGISLPHHAASQAQMGTKIDYASAQPGDLVFYAKNGSINHVAMYIGNGQVIHASSPKTGIKISTWNYRTPACIRRYLPN